MSIQKPNTKICQTKRYPEIKYTKTNKIKHTKITQNIYFKQKAIRKSNTQKLTNMSIQKTIRTYVKQNKIRKSNTQNKTQK